MATQEKEKIKVKHLEKALVKLLDEVKQKKTDLSKTIRKDNMSKTLSDLHERLKQENSDSEFLEGHKGKSLVLNIREWENFENLPSDFKQSISAFKFEEKKLADKKHGDVKNPLTPSSPKCSRTENQSVDVGSAPVPTPSSQSPSTSKQRHGKGAETENHQEKIQLPSTTNKQRPGKEAVTENHQEKIQKLQKELEEEREKTAELLHKFDDRGKQIQGLENDVEEKDKKIKFLDEESKHLAQRQTLEAELEKERKKVLELRHKLDDSMKQVEKYFKESEHLNTELETEKKTVKEKSHILDDRRKKINDLVKIITEKDEQLKVSRDEAEHLSRRLKDENIKRTNVEKDLKEKEKLAMGLERQANDYFCENQQLQDKVKELESTCKTLAKEKNQVEHNAKKRIEHIEGYFKDEKRKYDDEYKKLLAERDDLGDRFSKLAGKKLQEQNADIADLSDPNRAMKLSERFGQLYDDEWTNAFESLTDKKLGVPLKDAINVLLHLLQECWTFCNNLMATQMGSLQNVFLHPDQNMANFDQKKTGFTDRPRIASKDQLSLQDLRKRVGVSPPVIEEVKQALLADSKTWDKREKKEFDKKHIEACTPYIIKCAEVCWLMALHDPPLVMKMDVKPGEKFDTNIYTVYSQSGQTIDFLVWPPLYNGKDGGLLSKGVAEPVKVVTKKK